MNCRYCGSEDLEFDETMVPFEHGGNPSVAATQIMCKSCQAEYVESKSGKVLSVYQMPFEGIKEIVIFSSIPIDELRRIFYEMILSNEGDEE